MLANINNSFSLSCSIEIGYNINIETNLNRLKAIRQDPRDKDKNRSYLLFFTRNTFIYFSFFNAAAKIRSRLSLSRSVFSKGLVRLPAARHRAVFAGDPASRAKVGASHQDARLTSTYIMPTQSMCNCCSNQNSIPIHCGARRSILSKLIYSR